MITTNIYYHIPRKEESRTFFDSNEKFTTRENVLGATFLEILNYSPSINLNEGKGLQGIIHALLNDKEALIKQYPDWTELMYDIISRSNRRYSEFVFEQVRGAFFPNLPSRTRCMFFCEKQNVEDWYSSMRLRSGLEKLSIYKFELSGKIHKADQRWINQDVLSHANYVDAAKKYWTGVPFETSNPINEILFSGKVRRIKKYDGIEDFKTQN